MTNTGTSFDSAVSRDFARIANVALPVAAVALVFLFLLPVASLPFCLALVVAIVGGVAGLGAWAVSAVIRPRS